MSELSVAAADAVLAQNFAPWVLATGVRAEATGADTATLRIPFSDRLCRIGGILCGQALLTGADTAMVIALAAAAAFIWQQRRAANPLYDLHVAGRRIFWVAACAGIIVFGSLMGAMFVSQQFLQNVLGYNTVEAGAAFLPAIYAIIAPAGSNVPLIVGGITLGCTVIAALAAFSARETFRIHLNDLGDKNAIPVPREEYDRIRRTGVDAPVQTTAPTS